MVLQLKEGVLLDLVAVALVVVVAVGRESDLDSHIRFEAHREELIEADGSLSEEA